MLESSFLNVWEYVGQKGYILFRVDEFWISEDTRCKWFFPSFTADSNCFKPDGWIVVIGHLSMEMKSEQSNKMEGFIIYL